MRAFRSIDDSPDTSPEPQVRAAVWDSLVSDLETDCIAVDVSDSALMNEEIYNVSGSSHASNGRTDSSSTGGSPVTDMMGDMVWPVSLNDWLTRRGEKPSKEFFLAAVQVALSLAVKLESQRKGDTDASVLCCDITYSNVAVNDEHGDSDFVTKSGVRQSGKTSGLDISDMKTNRKEILCLGQVFFRLFTRGSDLPMNQLIKKPSNLESSFMNLTSETDGRFRLNYDDTESYESSLHERFHDSYRKSPFAATGAEKGILGLANKQRKGEGNSPLTFMQIAGVPSSVCRLINDMLMDEDDEGVDSLFRNDQAIASFRDVVQDLEQMSADPDSFLNDSLALLFKPIISDRIYGRDKDLKLVFDVASKVSSQSDAQRQDVVMISGHSGCGKSSLVNELITHVHKKRWSIVHCKFDALSAGVSAVLSAFDQFFQEINEEERGNSDEELQSMRSQVMTHFDANNLDFLCGIIPNFLGFVKDETHLIHADSRERNTFNSGEVQAATSRLNLLLNLMVKLMSSAQRPLLLFLDDLHWGDETVMALLNTLVDDLSQEAGLSNNSKRVLIVGSYRDNEVDEKHPLQVTIEHIKKCEHVDMTELNLNGLSSTDVELMVSDSLVYPRRLTRSLSKLIHQKSIGNPLFVREFLQELSAENLLTYSLANKKWEWNEDTIQDKTVTNSVAELLTRRLSRLPDSVLEGLRIMSCFGSHVDCQVLTLVKDMVETTSRVPQDQSKTRVNTDIFTELDFAISEGLIERNKGSYRFSHDIIYEAVEQGLDSDRQVNMFRDLVKALLRSTQDKELDHVVFVLATLINRIGSSRTLDPVNRTRYAELNLSAGDKAIQTADFASALVYIQSGVSFLNSSCWQCDYRLTLSLHEKNAVANWALGHVDAMKSSIEIVIKHARCFDDKISSIHLLVHSLGLDGKSVTKATSHGFAVLEFLGESFPTSMSNPTYIVKELSDLKSQLKDFIPTPVSAPLQIDNFPMLTDRTKLKCMSFLWELSYLFYSQKSIWLHVINARMIKLTMKYGLCTFSSVAFAMTGLSFAFVLKDVSEGYRLGKIALSLVQYNLSFKYLLPEVYAVVYGALSVWKEPIQVLLPPLLEAYQVCIRSGKTSTAGATCMLYSYRALFSGVQLANIHKDVIGFTRVMFTKKRTLILLCLQPIMQAVMGLRGIPSQTGKNWSDGAGYDSVREHLAQLVQKSEMTLCESFFAIIMMNSFIFHKGEDAQHVVKEYLELFQRNDETYPEHFVSVYRCFYGGLISFHYYRKTKDDYWLDKGEYTMKKIEAWNLNSAWNFQNKVCLLQAEYNFSLGKVSRAQQLYNMAIELSYKHRFTPEEAIACELSRSFHMTMKGGANSDDLLKRAYKCYQLWGADAKANAIAHASSASLFDN